MDILVRKGDLQAERCDILALAWFEDAKRQNAATTAVDKAMGGLLSATAKEDKFSGKIGEVLWVRSKGGVLAKRVLVVGCGKGKEGDLESMRSAAAFILNVVKPLEAKSVVVPILGSDFRGLNARTAAKAMVEGLRLAAYTFGRYKKEKKEQPPKQVTLLAEDARSERLAQDGAAQGELFARATVYARDLVNTPGLHMSPADLVAAAKEVAKGKGVRVRVYDKEQLKKMKAGGILGVGQGSDHDPALVHLIYKPKGKAKKKVALVGKAITFDSGGLSLKPADSMMTMKIDMAGAADVLAVFSVLPALAPNVEVHGIFGACENMPSGKAIRPGDVVEVMNGKTIEILNTDAEGRVTLADSLTYATKQKPDMIVDIATLTGACMVALGEEITGLMSNTPKLANQVLVAAANAGEKMWELPLEKRYQPDIKSEVADYKNITGKYGGALTAGLLLQEFVNNIPWVHLDIAGPSFAEKPLNPYTRRGASGHGVRTLLEFLRNI
jgi:leucyl aminopeptidase